jgi:hypothetical protein
MAFNYECDFNLQSRRLTPIAKRQDVRLAMLECISEAIQWNRDNFFDQYIEGDSAAAHNPATAYVKYDRVNYQNKIYECIQDNTGELPTNEDYWVKVVNDFRGVIERIRYNGQKLMLEWILNKWFGTTFVQPNFLGTTSDFYIVANDRFIPSFTVSETPFRSMVYVSSSVFESSSKTRKFIKETPAYTASSNFTVYYPVGTIMSTASNEYYQMVDLVNKYKVIGTTVDYISY